MGLFKKESGDIIDYTLLQKKGILKLPKQKEEVIDLTKNLNSNDSTNQTGNISPFGFLDSLAGASGQTNSVNAGFQTSNDNSEINALKLKIDDLEYKLARLTEKLDKVNSFLDKDNLK